MNPQDVELTDEAINALFMEEPEDKKAAISDAKNTIYQEFLEGVKGTRFAKNVLGKNKNFEVDQLKVSEHNSLWLDLGVIFFPEENKKYLVVSSPFSYGNAVTLLIENTSFKVDEVSFKHMFELQNRNQYIKTQTIQYLEEFLKPRPVLDRLDDEEKDVFRGVF